MIEHITSRNRASQKTVLDRATKAIQTNDYAAVEAALDAYSCAPYGNTLKWKAEAEWTKHVNLLGETDAAAAVAAARDAYEIAPYGSTLKWAAEAVWTRYIDALATKNVAAAVAAAQDAARNVALGSDLQRQAVKSIMKHVNKLGETDAAAAVAAARDAYECGTSGCYSQRQAVASILKHVDKLGETDADAAVAVARYAAQTARVFVEAEYTTAAIEAAHYAPRPSADYISAGGLLRQAVASILKHVDALGETDKPAAIEAARDAYEFAPSGSALQRQAFEKVRQLKPRSDPSTPTEQNTKRFAAQFQFG
jgi:hypothetical protein